MLFSASSSLDAHHRQLIMQEELFAGQHLPKYRTSMMPHAKSSRRPQLATIASANDSPTKTRRDMSVAPASLGPRPSLAPRARTLTSTLAKSDPSTLHFQRGSCDACGRTDDGKRKVRMIPCDVSTAVIHLALRGSPDQS